MKYQVYFWLIFLPLFLFAETGARGSKITRATLSCIKINPSVQNGKLTPDTVIESSLNYSIDLPRLKKERFSITILFGSNEGQSFLFNKKKTQFGEAEIFLKEPTGTITIKYPMSEIWMDHRLRRPVSVTFYIIEREKNGASQAIASAGPFVFRTLP